MMKYLIDVQVGEMLSSPGFSLTDLTGKPLVQLLAIVGAVFALTFLYRLMPRVRIGLDRSQTSTPIHVLVSSADPTSPVYASLIQRFKNSIKISLKTRKDTDKDEPFDNAIIVANEDLYTTTALLKKTIAYADLRNLVVVEVIKGKQENGTSADKLSGANTEVDKIQKYGNHAYLRRLVEGVVPEYPNVRIRLCTIDNDVMAEPAVAEELEEFLRTPSISYIRLNRPELLRPKLYRLHIALIGMAFVLFMVFGSPWVTMMDPVTMKPKKGFNPAIKSVAVATNIPIKLGIVHGMLYAFEFFLDPELFKRHVGQRLTTLWFQLFQFQRFGQHLQMHIETLVQAADVLTSTSPLVRQAVVRFFLYVVIAGVLTQNALTSYGWHSLQEQAIGFGLGLLKLIAFDLAPHGARVNRYVGESLSRGIQWLGGAISLGGGLFLNDFAPLHPTAMASLIAVGGAITLLILVGVRGGFRTGGWARAAAL